MLGDFNLNGNNLRCTIKSPKFGRKLPMLTSRQSHPLSTSSYCSFQQPSITLNESMLMSSVHSLPAMSQEVYVAITLLSLVLGKSASNVRLFESTANCNGGYRACPNAGAGTCCFGGNLYESCDSRNSQRPVQPFSRQPGEICGVQLGDCSLCRGVSNEIPVISGCKWINPSKRSAISSLLWHSQLCYALRSDCKQQELPTGYGPP
jgi:hypothetical protein